MRNPLQGMVFWIAAVTQGVALGWFVWPLQGQGGRSWIRRKVFQPIMFRDETIPNATTITKRKRVNLYSRYSLVRASCLYFQAEATTRYKHEAPASESVLQLEVFIQVNRKSIIINQIMTCNYLIDLGSNVWHVQSRFEWPWARRTPSLRREDWSRYSPYFQHPSSRLPFSTNTAI